MGMILSSYHMAALIYQCSSYTEPRRPRPGGGSHRTANGRAGVVPRPGQTTHGKSRNLLLEQFPVIMGPENNDRNTQFTLRNPKARPVSFLSAFFAAGDRRPQ